MVVSGSVRRNARIRCCQSQSMGELPNSGVTSDATNSSSEL